MTDTTKLVQTTVKYRTQRAKIKARQRQELEDELEPWKADVGDEISNVRRQGLSVQDVCNAIGNQNRTFVYDMINAANRRNGTTGQSLVAGTTVFDSDPGPTGESEYHIGWFDGYAEVVFDEDERYVVIVVDGVPDLPEEWADHTKERRVLYKDIISEIKNHDWEG